jgi:hypothetical protein
LVISFAFLDRGALANECTEEIHGERFPVFYAFAHPRFQGLCMNQLFLLGGQAPLAGGLSKRCRLIVFAAPEGADDVVLDDVVVAVLAQPFEGFVLAGAGMDAP